MFEIIVCCSLIVAGMAICALSYAAWRMHQRLEEAEDSTSTETAALEAKFAQAQNLHEETIKSILKTAAHQGSEIIAVEEMCSTLSDQVEALQAEIAKRPALPPSQFPEGFDLVGYYESVMANHQVNLPPLSPEEYLAVKAAGNMTEGKPEN